MGLNFGRKIFCVCVLFILLGCKKNDNNIPAAPPYRQFTKTGARKFCERRRRKLVNTNGKFRIFFL